MTLLELLVKELPSRGGWPDGVERLEQYPDGSLFDGPNYQSNFKFQRVDDFGDDEVTREQYESALAASKPEWNGEGLPPVGCECEFFDCEKWFKVTMMYGGSQLVVLYDHDNEIERSFSTSHIDGKFRPIRSEADKKRDEAIKQICDVLSVGKNTEDDAKNIYEYIKSGKIVID